MNSNWKNTHNAGEWWTLVDEEANTKAIIRTEEINGMMVQIEGNTEEEYNESRQELIDFFNEHNNNVQEIQKAYPLRLSQQVLQNMAKAIDGAGLVGNLSKGGDDNA